VATGGGAVRLAKGACKFARRTGRASPPPAARLPSPRTPAGCGAAAPSRGSLRPALRNGAAPHFLPSQMEEEGVPSTALREVSLLQMLSESIFVVRCAAGALPLLALALVASRAQNDSLGARPLSKAGRRRRRSARGRPAPWSRVVRLRSPRRTLASCPLA